MPAALYVTRGSGNSFKPALLLRQTGRSLPMHFLDVLAGSSRAPKFLAINPRGQVPYLVLEDGRGIGESNAIAWWLAEGTPLMPAEAASRAQALLDAHLEAEGGFDLARLPAVGRWMQRVRQTPAPAEVGSLLA